jgi:hypothetical protein
MADTEGKESKKYKAVTCLKKHECKLTTAHDCHLLVNHGSSSRCCLGKRIDIHIMREQARGFNTGFSQRRSLDSVEQNKLPGGSET